MDAASLVLSDEVFPGIRSVLPVWVSALDRVSRNDVAASHSLISPGIMCGCVDGP